MGKEELVSIGVRPPAPHQPHSNPLRPGRPLLPVKLQARKWPCPHPRNPGRPGRASKGLMSPLSRCSTATTGPAAGTCTSFRISASRGVATAGREKRQLKARALSPAWRWGSTGAEGWPRAGAPWWWRRLWEVEGAEFRAQGLVWGRAERRRTTLTVSTVSGLQGLSTRRPLSKPSAPEAPPPDRQA